ncbi:hypothetical protein [Luteococcus japonicus]|nr:hypothetical protein [Luteococcus japonicus]
MLDRPDGADWRSLMASEPTLALLTGVRSARPSMARAEELGWLTIDRRGKARPPAIKPGRCHGSMRWTPWAIDAVDALVERRPDNIVAQLIMLAEHPVWDSWSPTVWVCALEVATHTTLQSRAAYSKAKAVLEEWDWPMLHPETMRDWADRVAQETGAAAARADAEKAREERKRARLAEADEVGRLRALVPAAPKRKRALDAWFSGVLAAMRAEPDGAAEVRRSMLRKLAKVETAPERAWVQWLATAWAEKSPVTGVEDAEKERARRLAVVPLVVVTVLGDAPQVDPRMVAHVEAGVAWIARKDAH